MSPILRSIRGTQNGSISWHPFFQKSDSIFENEHEVKLFFVWVGYLANIGYSMDEAVYINLDETAIAYHYGGKKGLKKINPNCGTKDMKDKTSVHLTRKHCTFIAAIASDTKVQQALPQVILPNVRGEKRKWARVIKDKTDCPNVHVMNGQAGWVNNDNMEHYFDIVQDHLKALNIEKTVIVMDCQACHRSYRILKKLKKMKWKVLLVPGKLTGLLQPLDVCFFKSFKKQLFENQVKDRMNSIDGLQSFESWANTCFRTLQNICPNAEAKPMFHKCGYAIPHANTSKSILHHIAADHVGFCRKLTVDELSVYIGKKSTALHPQLFGQAIPADKRNHHVVVRNPLVRRRSKFSVHHDV